MMSWYFEVFPGSVKFGPSVSRVSFLPEASTVPSYTHRFVIIEPNHVPTYFFFCGSYPSVSTIFPSPPSGPGQRPSPTAQISPTILTVSVPLNFVGGCPGSPGQSLSYV